ncbi:hypothetical protein A2Z67_01405 [Candidatus Woesebacteria bacterium RBG_13_36_22]|uniref:Uncharacterized protein n=1 Tax=Candidatus Woesebacteria bacterium RBG_13_36_22 TaxID=1802478 RepID=A0A1F7X3J3_9BACT|nr:MAG: hypothetical protein A2Z67_01405 [Candidatus Woesebacteria bacterium RBG_13_36_22]
MNQIFCLLMYHHDNSSFWTTFGGPIAILTGVIISGTIGVWLFNKGIKKERILEKERREQDKIVAGDKHKEQLNKLKNHLVTLLDGCLVTAHKQNDNYLNYAQEFLNDLMGQHFPAQYTHSDLQRLLKIKTEDILEIFEINGLSNKDFINSLHHLDYLSEVFQRIPIDIHEGNGKTVIDLANQMISIRTQILNIGSNYVNEQIQSDPDYKQNPTWNFINDLILNYHKDYDGIPSVKWDYNKLFVLIKSGLLQEQFRYQNICNQLIDLAKVGGDIVFSIKQFNEALCKDIITANVRINDSLKNLEEIKKKLEG